MAVSQVQSIFKKNAGNSILGSPSAINENIQALVQLLTRMKLMDVNSENQIAEQENQGRIYQELEAARSKNQYGHIAATGAENRATEVTKTRLSMAEAYQKALYKAKEDGKLQALDQAWYEAQRDGDQDTMDKVTSAMTARTAKIATGIYGIANGLNPSPEIYQAMMSLGDNATQGLITDAGQSARQREHIKYVDQPGQALKSQENQIEAAKIGLTTGGKTLVTEKQNRDVQLGGVKSLRAYYSGSNLPMDAIETGMDALQIARPTSKVVVPEKLRGEILQKLAEWEVKLGKEALSPKELSQYTKLWNSDAVREYSDKTGGALVGGPGVLAKTTGPAVTEQEKVEWQRAYDLAKERNSKLYHNDGYMIEKASREAADTYLKLVRQLGNPKGGDVANVDIPIR